MLHALWWNELGMFRFMGAMEIAVAIASSPFEPEERHMQKHGDGNRHIESRIANTAHDGKLAGSRGSPSTATVLRIFRSRTAQGAPLRLATAPRRANSIHDPNIALA
jgi:hypothetical protein